jgi:CheY-like chemotaxis protein
MGGSISVASEPGKGSRFSFELMLPAAAPPPVVAPARANVAQLDGLEVLLVEDNPTNQLVARRLLERQGASVKLAVNGREAVEFIERGAHFNAVLMDLQMPELDGLEATRKLRTMPAFGQTPIIAMTADVLTERERCIEAGMNDHLTKPIEPPKLYATLARWTKPGEQAKQ